MASLQTTIYDKFCKGDPLSDSELAVGIKHFTNLADELIKSGPVFKLAANEAFRVSQRLMDYANERKRK